MRVFFNSGMHRVVWRSENLVKRVDVDLHLRQSEAGDGWGVGEMNCLLLIWVSHQSSMRSFAGLNKPALPAAYIDTDTTTSNPSATAPIVRPAAQATDNAPEAGV